MTTKATAPMQSTADKIVPSGLSRQHRLTAILFVLPTALLILTLTIYPTLRTIYLSFNSLEMAVSPVEKFIGLQNYIDLFAKDPRFWNAMQNTAYLVIVGIVIQLILGTGLALLASEMGRWRSFWLSLFLIPVMIAPVVAGFQFRVIFNDTFGPLNYLISWFSGGTVRGPLWLADSNWALFSIMLTDVWQWTPFMILIMLAGFQSIPVELTEAAEVDGASYWQIFWRIKIPMLLPVVIIALLIRMMDIFKTFDLVYLLTGGGPGDSTETVAFYTYLNGFKDFSLGYTAAMSFIQLIVIIIVARVFLRLQKQQQGGNARA